MLKNIGILAALIMVAAACIVLPLMVPVPSVHAQKVADPKYAFGGNGTIKFSPADLGVNALVEPAAGTSALSSIVDLTGSTSFTLKFSCTAGNITLNVQTYAEDGTTTLALIPVLSAVPAATFTDFYATTTFDTQSTSGTLGTKFRLPQKAVAFSFTNAGGAGTCTARMFLVY